MNGVEVEICDTERSVVVEVKEETPQQHHQVKKNIEAEGDEEEEEEVVGAIIPPPTILPVEIDLDLKALALTTPQPNVARQDSGVLEDLVSPVSESSGKLVNQEEEDPDNTINFGEECNITVIHATESEGYRAEQAAASAPTITNGKKDYANESKDSKDGSDSGVEGCATESARVRSRNSTDYASSCGGLDCEASCDSSLVSCCSVYEDPCATLPDDDDDVRLTPGGGGEGTSEGGSESSSIASAAVDGNIPHVPGCGPRTSNSSSSSSSVNRRTPGSHVSSNHVNRKKLGVAGDVQKPTSNRTKSVSNSSIIHQSSTALLPTQSSRSKSRTGTPSNVMTTSLTKSSQSFKTPSSTTLATNATQSVRDNRTRSRDKSLVSSTDRGGSSTHEVQQLNRGATASSSSLTCRSTNTSWTRTRTKQIPDSLPSVLTTEINKDLAQRGNLTSRSRGGSLSTARSAGTKIIEESRRSLAHSSRAQILYSGTARKNLDDKTLDAYATLPRRNRNKVTSTTTSSSSSVKNDNNKTEKSMVNCRSRSGSRETSLNRLTSDKRRTIFTGKDSSSIMHKSLPPYPRHKAWEKTRIYHETGSQTGLTIQDIEKALSGVPNAIQGAEFVERSTQESQTEGTWDDLQEMRGDIKRLNEQNGVLKDENDKLKAETSELKRLLEEEKADHAFARRELDNNAQRVLALLGTPRSEHTEGSDSLLELETHFQSSGQVVENQKLEIADLQSLCRMLSRDLEKSLAAQKTLLQQQQELEAESAEMQDFLQEEKFTLVEALKDAETEVKVKEDVLAQKEQELERQIEECKHLVRISEQRRQENLSLTMKLNAVERKCRELLLTQGAAVSGAAVALSGLGNRLEALVDQLISSYGISEKDLEDVVYHNEAYSRSNSSIESSPVSSKHSLKECTPSPKSGSFVSAVIGAIRNAATHPFAAKTTDKRSCSESAKQQIYKELSTESSSDLLDFETEPCLMMESVLEDVTLPDTYSHNMISSSDSLRRALSFPETAEDRSCLKKNRIGDESTTSLTNLTQAILHRRKVEDEEEDEEFESVSESDNGTSDNPAPLNDYCPAVSLVDQVIDVDNLVTKLLKVLRIIQLDNDTCIQELKEERSELESKLDATINELEEIRKTVVLNQSEEILNNTSDRRRSMMENCRLLIKEVIADDIVNKL